MTQEEYTRLAGIYMDHVLRLAMMGCKDRATAEDITQIVFLKLWDTDTEFTSDEHVRNWLFRITRNECNSFFRSSWHKRIVPLSERKEASVSYEIKEESPLTKAVRELKQKYREVVHLYYYEELSVREIATILGITETAVQTRLQRAREALKKELEKGGHHYD